MLSPNLTHPSRRSLLLSLTGVATLQAADTNSATDRLLERIIASEQRMLQTLAERSPIVETYLQQDSTSDAQARDHYFLGRMKLIDSVNYVSFLRRSSEAPVPEPRPEPKSKLKLPFGKKASAQSEAPQQVGFLPLGFAQMAVIDAKHFDRKTYQFEFVRREFLGELRCLVFDISPVNREEAGRFIGRIWVEDENACIVRLNGTYTLRSSTGVYYHFDSWRLQQSADLWIPALIYIEDSVDGPSGSRFKGQTRIWSYESQSRRKLEELTSLLVESENAVESGEARQELSPLESQRRWEREAEQNVLERLEKIGLIAPAGEVDKVLNTVLNNLIVTNDLDVDAQCRLLLTTPLETFTIGSTVAISRGLVDVLPDEASLALALAMELSHIALGHPTRTEYAFNDRIMVEDEAVLDRFRFSRPPEEVAAAMKKAVTLIAKSPYQAKLAGAGLFLRALEQKSPSLPRLIQATLGNDLSLYLKTPEFMELLAKAPSIEDTKLEQIAALPLGSRVRLEPWANQSYLMKTRSLSLLSAREKMPFEVAPVNLRLTRLPKVTVSKAATP